MRRNYKLEKLQNGETLITSEKGNSMTPLIKSGQEHKLTPILWDDCNEGDIVFIPFMGSGSEVVSAINNKREYIGVELDKEHFDNSIERIKQLTLTEHIEIK